MLTKKGFDTDRYPGKLEQLERARLQHEQHGPTPLAPSDATGWLEAIAVTDLGWTSLQPKIPAAEGLATVVGGYANMNLALLIQDLDTHALITAANAHEPFGYIMSLKTVKAQATKATQLIALLMYTYDKNGKTYHGTTPKILQNNVIQATATVTAPTRTTSTAGRSDRYDRILHRWYQSDAAQLEFSSGPVHFRPRQPAYVWEHHLEFRYGNVFLL